MIKSKAFLTALIVTATTFTAPFNCKPCTSVNAAGSYDMNVSIDLGGEKKAISPYIYGINQYGNQSNYKEVTANAIRQGGNRMTAYNWENNASNAGSDWKYSSDNNLSSSDAPADCAQTLSAEAAKYGFDYKLTTLQLAGYVAADKDGTVLESEAAPSDRWNKVVLTKDSAFAEEPDLEDDTVYMNEYVNYIVNKLGDSNSTSGIQAYSLDNEPALWHHTHSRIHPQPVGITELSEKSIEMAKAVKAIDADAEIFGPSLYGYTAFDHLADTDESNEWEQIKAENGYNWYLDYYLNEMNKAEAETGTRLLDVLDIHYYSESAREGAEDRLQSVRTLYEKGFVENSWIGQWCQANVPILPTIQKSIDTYYPGTKLAITEYNFGGGDISGTIAQAEALGCFADAEVYFASLWGSDSFIFSGINLYTNYDGNGGSFGNTLVPTVTDDVSLASSYAAINDSDSGLVTAMLTNKSFTDSENATITLENSETDYEAAAVYAVYGDSEEIRLIDIIKDVNNNEVNVTLPALSAATIVITDDASDFDGLSKYDENEVVEKIVTFDDLSDRINANGYVEVPVEDPEHLTKAIMTANVTSSAGSSWGSAGCAISINAVDKEKNKFWTSKSYSLNLGSNSSATVKFDGIFSNDGTDVEAVIADGKLEFQKWWDSSEKMEAGIDDIIDVEYVTIQLVYEYTSKALAGDANVDGEVTIADAIFIMQSLANPSKYVISEEGLTNADVYATGDGVNAQDALSIQKYRTGIINELPEV